MLNSIPPPPPPNNTKQLLKRIEHLETKLNEALQVIEELKQDKRNMYQLGFDACVLKIKKITDDYDERQRKERCNDS
jgi:uncharacterized protein (UPF0335 family)